MSSRSALLLASVIALGVAGAPRSGGAKESAAPRASVPAAAVAAVAAVAPAESLAPRARVAEPQRVEFERAWRGFGEPRCSYLRPSSTADFVGADGGVDVVFHFHAGQMSEREMKASGVRGVFVSCGYGMGTTPYARAFEDPSRFGVMMKRLLRAVAKSADRKDVHLRRLALVSWSAGYAAVSRILAVPEWYDATDTVVLLDSLHARYVDPEPTPAGAKAKAKAAPLAARGKDHVDVRQLQRFARFAADAADGKKTMVVTHSSIVPPDYASTTEATAALLSEVGVDASTLDEAETDARGMSLLVRADEGGLHVRGFRGTGPRDHFDHLYLIGHVLESWVVPRWYSVSKRP